MIKKLWITIKNKKKIGFILIPISNKNLLKMDSIFKIVKEQENSYDIKVIVVYYN